MDRKDEVLTKLQAIIDPDLGKNIVELGFVQHLRISDDGAVAFELQLTTPACPVKEQFRAACAQALGQLSWVRDVAVTISSMKSKSPLAGVGEGMKGVRNIVAVASCKGGVGKSTTAVNLAYALAARNAAVGLFDADVYGPSLPTLIDADVQGLFQKNNLIIPVDCQGVRLMSFAYANPDRSGPAIMRGPMVTQIINQLLTGTNWGELDYLIIDMPPGTGDVQLTLSQIIPITAAVIVTTPQELSFVDVVKGIQMFHKLNVPTIAVIENMSYFVCDRCQAEHRLFGTGALQRLVDQFGIKNSFALPLDPELSRCSDSGVPFVVQQPESAMTLRFLQIADAVVREVSKLRYGKISEPKVTFVPGTGIVYTNGAVEGVALEPAMLRRQCRCARCVHEFTGERMLRDMDVADTIVPSSMQPMGNYAVAIQWSDGHSSIYPYEMLRELQGSSLRS